MIAVYISRVARLAHSAWKDREAGKKLLNEFKKDFTVRVIDPCLVFILFMKNKIFSGVYLPADISILDI